MPYLIAIDTAQAVTRVWFHGEITGADIIAATDELVASPEFDAGFDQFWSLMEVTALDLSPAEMEALVAHDQDLVETGAMGRVKVAIVVTTELRELAIRLYQHWMQDSGQDVRLFREPVAAEAWLRELKVE